MKVEVLTQRSFIVPHVAEIVILDDRARLTLFGVDEWAGVDETLDRVAALRDALTEIINKAGDNR